MTTPHPVSVRLQPGTHSRGLPTLGSWRPPRVRPLQGLEVQPRYPQAPLPAAGGSPGARPAAALPPGPGRRSRRRRRRGAGEAGAGAGPPVTLAGERQPLGPGAGLGSALWGAF